MVARAAPVIMLVAPGPMEEVQINAFSRLFALAYPAAMWTAACSLRTEGVGRSGSRSALVLCRHVAVAEDAENAREEAVLLAIRARRIGS